MSIEQRIEAYIQERDACQEAEDKAHKRKLELNKMIKKLHFAKRDLEIALKETEINNG